MKKERKSMEKKVLMVDDDESLARGLGL